MTLSDRLKAIRAGKPKQLPRIGRPGELDKEVEEAIVKCLVACAEFHYPMSRKNLLKEVFLTAFCPILERYRTFISISVPNPDPPGSKIIWLQGFGSKIINFGSGN